MDPLFEFYASPRLLLTGKGSPGLPPIPVFEGAGFFGNVFSRFLVPLLRNLGASLVNKGVDKLEQKISGPSRTTGMTGRGRRRPGKQCGGRAASRRGRVSKRARSGRRLKKPRTRKGRARVRRKVGGRRARRMRKPLLKRELFNLFPPGGGRPVGP